jgi:UPF0716 protein FxsA
MLRILFLIFVLVPLVELYVLIEVGSGLGGLATIALCLLTAAVGGLIIRWQGVQTLLNARQSIQTAQQHQLAEHGMHGVMLVLAGALLFLPGFITDTIGFLLLIPAFRRFLIWRNTVPYERATGHHNKQTRYESVVDAEVIKKD